MLVTPSWTASLIEIELKCLQPGFCSLNRSQQTALLQVEKTTRLVHFDCWLNVWMLARKSDDEQTRSPHFLAASLMPH